MSEIIDDDHDNPEWTEEDFARAKGPETLPPEVLALFPKTAARLGRPPKENRKQAVNLRLDPDVLAFFKAGGSGWQSRINAALREKLSG